MAWENVKSRIPSLVASADLSANQHLFVIVDSNGKVAVNSTAGGIVDGVLQNKPAAANRTAEVAALDGASVSKVYSGAVVTKGSRVQSDAAGKAIDAATTKYSCGKALEAASKADVLIPVLLVPYGYEP